MSTLCLIDGDIVAYRCAASCWKAKTNETIAPLRIATYRIEDMLNGISKALESNHFRIFLSDSTGFRNVIDSNYKANRIGLPRPPYLDACKNYLINRHYAEVCEEAEADDGLGIAQCENNNTVICSIDKDLYQIPGLHYNFVTGKHRAVTPMEGLRHFYKQLLIGDVADNVKGVWRIGEKTANILINPLDSEEEMFDCVRELYKDDVRLLMNCDLLWIRQKHNEMYTSRSYQMLKGFDLHENAEC